MQTFLPYKNFTETADCLDYRRLGKQRVEAKQILDILLNRTTSKAWRNHPAVIMWKGYENCLKYYYNCILLEWINRGFKNTMIFEITERKVIYPRWFDYEDVFRSHKSNLLRKDKAYYSQFSWAEPDNLPYFWPVNED